MPDLKATKSKISLSIPTQMGRTDRLPIERMTIEEWKAIAAMNRLNTHLNLLKTLNLPDLDEAGTVTLNGLIIPSRGVFHAGLMLKQPLKPGAHKILDAKFTNARGQSRRIPRNRRPTILPAVQPQFPKSFNAIANVMSIPTAYLYMDILDLGASAKILLDSNLSKIVIIANSITARSGSLEIAWNRPETKAAEPQGGSPATQSVGVKGRDGANGVRGDHGLSAPDVEIWINGAIVDAQLQPLATPLRVNLEGQAGQAGQAGQKGGQGGRGRPGAPSRENKFLGIAVDCASGPQSGKRGAQGGDGGDGGLGGNGGNSGNLEIFTTDALLKTYYESTELTSNGAPGGKGGATTRNAGSGGVGGPRGQNRGYCANFSFSDRTQGPTGSRGRTGTAGADGNAGAPGVLTVTVISQTDFNAKVNAPGIAILWPEYGPALSPLGIGGVNFSDTDVVTLNGQTVAASFSDGTPFQQQMVDVPDVEGGPLSVQVTRGEGSNIVNYHVTPVITALSHSRIRPGERLTIEGTGFSATQDVRFNGQPADDITFIDKRTLEVTVLRPTNIVRNPAGEEVTVTVVDTLGHSSNPQPLILDTFRIICAGDSIPTGQGNLDSHKYITRVTDFVRQNNPDIGIYESRVSQSGAFLIRPVSPAAIDCDDKDLVPDTNTVIAGDPSERNFHPEIPRPFPTAREQILDLVSAEPGMNENVRLILLTAGIRNVGIFSNIVDPTGGSPAEKEALIRARSNTYCFGAMRDVLTQAGTDFPNADIVVAGYFQIFSQQSRAFDNPATATAVLAAYGLGGIVGLLALDEIRDRIVDQCRIATEVMDTDLSRAVDQANLNLNTDRIRFVSPNFGPQHSLFAADSLVYGLNDAVNPEDSMVQTRRDFCPVSRNDNSGTLGGVVCRYASVGHPNGLGAKRYADAITAVL